MDPTTVSCITCHDTLLGHWESRLAPFNRDGILFPEQWLASHPKLLFVLKETNQSDRSKALDVTASIAKALDNPNSHWWKKGVLRRVGRWAYGLTHYGGAVPGYEDACAGIKDSIRRIAYVNMKKSPGGARTRPTSFDAHIREHARYIRRQIELIEPDIVVLGGTYSPIKKYVFPELERACHRIHLHAGMVFINAYHPAQTTIPAEELYGQVLNSYHAYRSGQATSQNARAPAST